MYVFILSANLPKIQRKTRQYFLQFCRIAGCCLKNLAKQWNFDKIISKIKGGDKGGIYMNANNGLRGK